MKIRLVGSFENCTFALWTYSENAEVAASVVDPD